jgi:DNA-binding CsgD family transcriptional regulator
MRAWRLTRREREVARLVIDGLSTEDIAAALFISVHTVRDHLKMIFGKIGVSRCQDMGRRPHRTNTRPGPCRPLIAGQARDNLTHRPQLIGKDLNRIRRAPSTTTPGPGPQGRGSRPPDRASRPETESQGDAFLSRMR